MGPVAFALAVHDANCGGRPLDWKVFYLDDGILVGNTLEVFQALEHLVLAYKAVGLECNLHKCTIWGPGVQKGTQSVPQYPMEVPLDHPCRAIPVVPFVAGSGLEVLGVPVDHPGTQDMTDKVWRGAVEGLRTACNKLQEFPHDQARYVLLRYCLDGCKVNHLLRSTSCVKAAGHVSTCSLVLRSATESLVGTAISDMQWFQASLPIKKNGGGIENPAVLQYPARVACSIGFHLNAAASIGLPRALVERHLPDFPQVLSALQVQLGPNFDPVQGWLAAPFVDLQSADKTHATQKWWAEHVYEELADRLPGTASIRDQARLAVQRNALGAAWLDCPTKRGIPDDDFKLLIRWHLGIPILPIGVQLPPCPLCQEAIDPHGDHFVTCSLNGCKQRHDQLRSAFSDSLRLSGILHLVEQRCSERTMLRPADVLLMHWEGGRHAAVDFVVSHPLQLSQYPLSADKASRHAASEERKKVQRIMSQEEFVESGWSFIPMGFGTFGNAGPSSIRLLSQVIQKATADLHGWEKTKRAMEIRLNISVALMRQVGRQLSLKNRVQDALDEECLG